MRFNGSRCLAPVIALILATVLYAQTAPTTQSNGPLDVYYAYMQATKEGHYKRAIAMHRTLSEQEKSIAYEIAVTSGLIQSLVEECEKKFGREAIQRIDLWLPRKGDPIEVIYHHDGTATLKWTGEFGSGNAAHRLEQEDGEWKMYMSKLKPAELPAMCAELKMERISAELGRRC